MKTFAGRWIFGSHLALSTFISIEPSFDKVFASVSDGWDVGACMRYCVSHKRKLQITLLWSSVNILHIITTTPCSDRF